MVPLHPAVVHFPIVLAILWPLVDACALMTKSRDLSRLAVVLLAAAVLASLVATATGQASFDAAVAEGVSKGLLSGHTDLADAMPWILIGVLAIRWGGAAKFGVAGRVAGLVAGLAVWPLIYHVGETGGVLVFEHQVGVHAIEKADK